MVRIIGGRLLGGLVLLSISIFLIILGAVLTVSIVFGFLGIPLIIIGLLMLISSILKIIFGTFGDALYLVFSPFRRTKKETPKAQTNEKVVDVEKKDGVYQK